MFNPSGDERPGMDEAGWLALSTSGGALVVFGLLLLEGTAWWLRGAVLLAGVSLSAFGFLRAAGVDEPSDE